MSKGRRGQAMIEFLMSLPVFLVIVVGLMALSEIVIVKQRMHSVARLGTELQTLGVLKDEIIRNELEDYAHHLHSPSRPAWKIEMSRYLGSASARFYKLRSTKVKTSLNSRLFSRRDLEEEVVAQRGETHD